MPDDRMNPGPEDGKRVSLEQADERRYWAKRFKVTQAELRKLVEVYGRSVKRIEEVTSTRRKHPVEAGVRDADLPLPVRDYATDV